MTKNKFVRLTWGTYLRLRKYFPAQENESLSSYFDRLSRYIESNLALIKPVKYLP